MADTCKRGHSYSLHGYPAADGKRQCRICNQEVGRRYSKQDSFNKRFGLVTQRRVSTGPFKEWLEEEVGDETMEEWSARHNINPDVVRKCLNGTHTQIGIDTIDKALTKAGVPWLLEEMYPLQEEVPA